MRTNGSDDPAEMLTQREYAAVHCMAALLSNPQSRIDAPDTKHLAFVAVAAADALFDELVK